GQIVIPLDVRREPGLREGERLEVTAKADGLVLTRVRARAGRPGWRAWGGALAGSGALEEHRKEHAREARR
ncbi:MAG: AbrB/MazE/SpoVT family DNA-binding domain-containing protein, partial [Acidobacteria bacterium ACB2]|nr:AbrB/MazE/SpoVT family DNA-binding domain-containing protein [Acidobacteria bacterium ACB2]